MLDADAIAASWSGSIRSTADSLGVAESTLRLWAQRDERIRKVLYGERPDTEFVNYDSAAKDATIRDLKRLNKHQAEAIGDRQAFIEQVIDAARAPFRSERF